MRMKDWYCSLCGNDISRDNPISLVEFGAYYIYEDYYFGNHLSSRSVIAHKSCVKRLYEEVVTDDKNLL